MLQRAIFFLRIFTQKRFRKKGKIWRKLGDLQSKHTSVKKELPVRNQTGLGKNNVDVKNGQQRYNNYSWLFCRHFVFLRNL